MYAAIKNEPMYAQYRKSPNTNVHLEPSFCTTAVDKNSADKVYSVYSTPVEY